MESDGIRIKKYILCIRYASTCWSNWLSKKYYRQRLITTQTIHPTSIQPPIKITTQPSKPSAVPTYHLSTDPLISKKNMPTAIPSALNQIIRMRAGPCLFRAPIRKLFFPCPYIRGISTRRPDPKSGDFKDGRDTVIGKFSHKSQRLSPK